MQDRSSSGTPCTKAMALCCAQGDRGPSSRSLCVRTHRQTAAPGVRYIAAQLQQAKNGVYASALHLNGTPAVLRKGRVQPTLQPVSSLSPAASARLPAAPSPARHGLLPQLSHRTSLDWTLSTRRSLDGTITSLNYTLPSLLETTLASEPRHSALDTSLGAESRCSALEATLGPESTFGPASAVGPGFTPLQRRALADPRWL